MTGEDKLIALCKLAIEEIDMQLERKRSINVAISHLKTFRFEAQEQNPTDKNWNDKFYDYWTVLEETYAVALDNEQKWFESEDIDRIDDTLLDMRRMLEDKITRLERTQRGSEEDHSKL